MPDEPSSSPKPQDRRWRPGQQQPPAKGRPRSAKRRQITAAAVVMLALAGAVIALLFLIRPAQTPYFLTIPITEYKARQYPPNPLARQDSNALERHFLQDRRNNAFQSQERHEVLKELQNLQTRKEAAVVVHLRALALSRGSDVFLLPGDARPDDPATWLKFVEVLQLIRQCPARHKLLILDIMQPLLDPRLGVLTSDVAEKAEAIIQSGDDQDLLVLCACSPGQVSLVSEEVNLSVFGYYLDQGLRGHADGYGPEGKQDGRVTVKELAAFVEKHVDRWAARNRATRQTPVLLGKGADFGLVVFDRARIEPTPEVAEAKPYPAWLSTGWKLRDQWLADESYSTAPQAIRRLEALQLHAEQRWRGGAQADNLQGQLDSDSLQGQLQHDRDGCTAQVERAEVERAEAMRVSRRARWHGPTTQPGSPIPPPPRRCKKCWPAWKSTCLPPRRNERRSMTS